MDDDPQVTQQHQTEAPDCPLGWELWGSEATFLKTVKVRLWTAVHSDQTVGDSIREDVGSWVN